MRNQVQISLEPPLLHRFPIRSVMVKENKPETGQVRAPLKVEVKQLNECPQSSRTKQLATEQTLVRTKTEGF